ncbi:MAG: potassium transporter KefB, partial [Alphaproteobacteria bacterium]|nr:potassium transporter KefB [Alphaproteobacteria bacterium]
GYIGAGVVLGPHALGLVERIDSARALAEFGVVFLLFTVGLELPLDRLRALGAGKFALGLLQILLTMTVFSAAGIAFGLSPQAAFVVSAALTLSSTAMVLQLLAERGELTSQAGRSAFAVLLVQDIAVGPLLVVTLVLGGAPEAIAEALFWSVLKALAAVVGILAIGRWAVRPIYGPISEGGQIETFTALTLLIVLATGLATELAGLSMAFGAFLAGMLLADTRHRHQVAAVIQPFRGLLLGLFFMTVGMAIDTAGVIARAGALAAIVVGLLIVKTAVAAAIGAALGMPRGRAVYVGLLLAGSGEFGFVLLGAAVGRSLLEGPDAQLLGMAVTLSMAATPLLAFAGRRALPDIAQESGERVETAEPHSGHVVVAGFGRAGRECAAQLRETGKLPVGIDIHADNIAAGRRLGFEVFHGDAARPEVLESAGVENASAVVVAFNDPKRAVTIVGQLRYIFPRLRIVARAHDEHWAEELRRVGADTVAVELQGVSQQLVAAVDEPAPDAPPQ